MKLGTLALEFLLGFALCGPAACSSGCNPSDAVDTIAAMVMGCDPTKVPSLTLLEADGHGTTDATQITVVGKQVADVATAFAGKQMGICRGEWPS